MPLVWEDDDEEEEAGEENVQKLASPSRPLAALPSQHTTYHLSNPLSYIPTTPSCDFDEDIDEDLATADVAASFLESCFNDFANNLGAELVGADEEPSEYENDQEDSDTRSFLGSLASEQAADARMRSWRKRRCEVAGLHAGRFDAGGMYFGGSMAKRRKTMREAW